nr:hypothetical protein [Nitrobacter winogradskyi]
MLAGNQPKAPVLDGDMTCVDRARENLRDSLDVNLVITVARERGLGFQKSLHFRQSLEAARGVAFESLPDDRRQWFLRHQHLAVSGNALVAVAHRSLKHPIAIHRPCAHAVAGLLCILLALMLRNRGQQVLTQDAIRILAELDGRAFQLPARLA